MISDVSLLAADLCAARRRPARLQPRPQLRPARRPPAAQLTAAKQPPPAPETATPPATGGTTVKRNSSAVKPPPRKFARLKPGAIMTNRMHALSHAAAIASACRAQRRPRTMRRPSSASNGSSGSCSRSSGRCSPKGRPADTAGFCRRSGRHPIVGRRTLDQRLDSLERQMTDLIRQTEENGYQPAHAREATSARSRGRSTATQRRSSSGGRGRERRLRLPVLVAVPGAGLQPEAEAAADPAQARPSTGRRRCSHGRRPIPARTPTRRIQAVGSRPV